MAKVAAMFFPNARFVASKFTYVRCRFARLSG